MIEHATARWLAWLSHLLVALGAATTGALAARYVLLFQRVGWLHGAWIGVTLAAIYYAHREGRDLERHRIQWARLRAMGQPEEAALYRKRWTLDGWVGFLGPALLWVLVTALVLLIYGG